MKKKAIAILVEIYFRSTVVLVTFATVERNALPKFNQLTFHLKWLEDPPKRPGGGRGEGEGGEGRGKKEEQPICIRSPILTVHSPYLLLWRSHTRMAQSTELLKRVRLLEEGWKRRRVTMPFDPCRLCVQ